MGRDRTGCMLVVGYLLFAGSLSVPSSRVSLLFLDCLTHEGEEKPKGILNSFKIGDSRTIIIVIIIIVNIIEQQNSTLYTKPLN